MSPEKTTIRELDPEVVHSMCVGAIMGGSMGPRHPDDDFGTYDITYTFAYPRYYSGENRIASYKTVTCKGGAEDYEVGLEYDLILKCSYVEETITPRKTWEEELIEAGDFKIKHGRVGELA